MAAAVKAQVGYFERFGAAGYAVLERLAREARGVNPGAGFVRIALVPEFDILIESRGPGYMAAHGLDLKKLHIVPNGITLDEWSEHGEPLDAAIQVAEEMCSNSPDALIVGRRGIRMSWETGNAEEAVSSLASEWYPRLVEGANFAEGIAAFSEKRSPQWVNSKL